MDEFKQLFSITSFQENVGCEFPTLLELGKLNIKSQELKNILTKYAGKKILIFAEPEKFNLPSDYNLYRIK